MNACAKMGKRNCEATSLRYSPHSHFHFAILLFQTQRDSFMPMMPARLHASKTTEAQYTLRDRLSKPFLRVSTDANSHPCTGRTAQRLLKQISMTTHSVPSVDAIIKRLSTTNNQGLPTCNMSKPLLQWAAGNMAVSATGNVRHILHERFSSNIRNLGPM
jgi:hypothetical protein